MVAGLLGDGMAKIVANPVLLACLPFLMPETSAGVQRAFGKANAHPQGKAAGGTLTFEENDDGEVVKFESKLVGERTTELTLPGAPVRIKPIQFARK